MTVIGILLMIRAKTQDPHSHMRWGSDQFRAKEIAMLVSLVVVTITALESEARFQLCALREDATGPAFKLSALPTPDIVLASWGLQKKASMTGKLHLLACECFVVAFWALPTCVGLLARTRQQ
jgi:hypothetical protein